LVRNLLALHCKVIIAGSGKSLHLLQDEFPSLENLKLPENPLKFSEKLSINTSVILQVKKFTNAIKSENKILYEFLKTQKIDGIISDNRYGIYSETIESILITHQLNLANDVPLKLFGQRILNKQLKKFHQIWIPDEAESLFSGDLSRKKAGNKKYIGILSRMENLALPRQNFILIIASGTEPHRTQFENKMISVLGNTGKRCVLVRGLPDRNSNEKEFPENFEVFNHLNSERLNKLLSSCALFISRNGYSTLMDIFKAQAPSVLFPTKGQAEQEYLSKNLEQTLNFKCRDLEQFELKDLEKPQILRGKSQIELKEILKSWLTNL